MAWYHNTIVGLKITPEVSHFLYGPIRMVLQQFKSNGWLPLSLTTPFTGLGVTSKGWSQCECLAMNFDCFVAQYDTKEALQMHSYTSSFLYRYSSKVLKYFISNGWLSLYHIPSFLMLRVHQKSSILTWFLVVMEWYNPLWAWRLSQKFLTSYMGP